jgi:hypothetical protein
MTPYLWRTQEDVMSDPKKPDPPTPEQDAVLDEALKETFPASDTPAALRRAPADPPNPA